MLSLRSLILFYTYSVTQFGDWIFTGNLYLDFVKFIVKNNRFMYAGHSQHT